MIESKESSMVSGETPVDEKMEKFREFFCANFLKILQNVNRLWMDLTREEQLDERKIAGLKLQFHNLKSDAAMMSYDEISSLARHMELFFEGALSNRSQIIKHRDVIDRALLELKTAQKSLEPRNAGVEIAKSKITELDVEIIRILHNSRKENEAHAEEKN
jgi:chemotaxis protein histidine kinase CheA